jgi:predicted AAA+ superfamily ATPase
MKKLEYQVLKGRLEEPNNWIQVVVGPSQVGKTTMVRQVLEDMNWPALMVSADDVPASNNAWIEQIWNQARIEAAQCQHRYILAIDEIQKIQQWSETVKRLFDADTSTNSAFKVVLLGSSKLMLEKGLTESLAGRFELIRMTHWRYHEMQEAFGFTPEQFVWFGGYPGAALLINDEPRWKLYVRDSLAETAISKDILMLTRVDKPALLRRLFETGSHYSGQILSYNKLMGQLQDAGNTTTLAHYLNLMDQAELLCGLEKYSVSQVRKKGSSPKFQTFNAALVNCYRTEILQMAKQNGQLWGRVVESAVGTHLLSFRNESFKLYYWRDGNNEVDFIMEYGNKIVALEVKTGNHIRSGMPAFIQNFKPHRSYIIGEGGIPWQQFLAMHPKQLF